MINRRNFIKKAGLTSAFLSIAYYNDHLWADTTTKNKNITAETAPLWKGFNLLNMFNPDYQTPFNEKDFEMTAEWGFNFMRIPLSYWCWSSEDDWYYIDDSVLKQIDRAVEYGKQYNLHINLNFHRVPGYCINKPKPPTNLFEEEAPLKACEFHWKTFAERYKGIPNTQLSFNLINEAPSVSVEKYDKVARCLINAIRYVDPERLIFVDGKDVGQTPLMTLTDVPNIIQSGRGYNPMIISHFRANWPEWDLLMTYPEDQLTWPITIDGQKHDKDFIRNSSVNPWKPWIEKGGKVHIGELGCYSKTPHKVAIAWLEDLFSVFKEQNWGWSLWNLEGDFGILNSNRKDVKYENYKGYKLDREMLELLKRS